MNKLQALQTMVRIIEEYDLQSVISFSGGSQSLYLHLYDESEMNKFDCVTQKVTESDTKFDVELKAVVDGIEIISLTTSKKMQAHEAPAFGR